MRAFVVGRHRLQNICQSPAQHIATDAMACTMSAYKHSFTKFIRTFSRLFLSFRLSHACCIINIIYRKTAVVAHFQLWCTTTVRSTAYAMLHGYMSDTAKAYKSAQLGAETTLDNSGRKLYALINAHERPHTHTQPHTRDSCYI